MIGFEAGAPPGGGMPSGNGSHSNGGGASGGFHLVRFEREIFPFLQSSQWVPANGADERDRVAGAYDVVFEHGVLREIRKAAERSPGSDVVGLLVGQGCECPWTRRLWVRVTGVVSPLDGAGRRWFSRLLGRRRSAPDQRPVDDRLADLLDREELPGGHVLGWFRGRPDRAPALTPDEVGIHGRKFPEPWQIAVIVPTSADEPTLGILGRDETGEMRPYRLRPFYLFDDGRSIRRPVVPANYRKVERITSAPGRTRLAIEVQHRKAPVLATAACTILGVMTGLGLSYELSRATRAGGYLGAATVDFARPAVDPDSPPTEPALTPEEIANREAAEAERVLPDLVDEFERRVGEYGTQRARPSSAETYCRDLGIAYDRVHVAYVALIRDRARLESSSAQAAITAATREKGAIDTHYDGSDCR